MQNYNILSFDEFINKHSADVVYSKIYDNAGSFPPTRIFDVDNPKPALHNGALDGTPSNIVRWTLVNNLEILGRGVMKSGDCVLCGHDVAGLVNASEPSPRLANRTLDEVMSSKAAGNNPPYPHIKKITYIDGPCLVLVRPGDHIFGHWLIDLMPYLQLLNTTNNLDDIDVLVSTQAPQYAIAWLEKLGVRRVHKMDVSQELTVLKHALIFTPTRLHHDFRYDFSIFGSWLYDALEIKPESIHLPTENVFLSRGSLPNLSRALLNREEIEACFSRRGFTILKPELLNISQQRFVFENTRRLAGEFGSALHNSMFCNRDAEVISLQSDKNRNRIQSTLCGQLGQINYSIHGVSIGANYTADFVLSPEFVDNCLEEVI